MGRLKKGRTMVNRDAQENEYIPSRELSYEQFVEQDWQFFTLDISAEDIMVRAAMVEKLQSILHSPSAEKMALVEELFYLKKTEGEAAKLFAVSQNTIHYRKNKVLEKLRKLIEK